MWVTVNSPKFGRGMKQKRPFDKSVYRSLTLISQFGINMIVPILMMCALGIYLDRKFGTSWITAVLFFAGAIAGAQNVYRMAKRIYDVPSEKDKILKELQSGKKDEHHKEQRDKK